MTTNNGQVKKKKLRLVAVHVTPSFVLDDGQNLTSVQTNSIIYTAEEWADITTHFAKAIDDLKETLGAS